jgi:hypothetical protein
VPASRPDVMFSVCMCARFKPHQEKFIWRLQREYWRTWSRHKMLVCSILKEQSLS